MTNAALPFLTSVGDHVIVHDGESGAPLLNTWTGLCVDSRDTSINWYIGAEGVERSFTRLDAKDEASARLEIERRRLDPAAPLLGPVAQATLVRTMFALDYEPSVEQMDVLKASLRRGKNDGSLREDEMTLFSRLGLDEEPPRAIPRERG